MTESPKLTDRQQQVLDLVQSAIERSGAPPTRAEIAAELGFRSANAAEEHLQALARKGVIELVGGTSSAASPSCSSSTEFIPNTTARPTTWRSWTSQRSPTSRNSHSARSGSRLTIR
jgi:SOS-response transcriptional repressor LexA